MTLSRPWDRGARSGRIARGMGLAALAFASACSLLTGADDLEFHDEPKSGTQGTSSSGPTGPGAGSGAGVGTGGEGGAGGQEPVDSTIEALGVSIDEVAIYQGVKRSLAVAGAAVNTGVKVVAGRDALVRLFVTQDGSYDGSPVHAHLFLGEGSTPLTVSQVVPGQPSDGSLASTLNFDVPGNLLLTSTTFRVELRQDAAATGTPGAAAYPASGFAPMPVESSGQKLRIELVPIAYAADGSNRLPDTSATQMARYRTRFRGMFPVPEVEINLHASVSWEGAVLANGSGWGQLLDGLANFRQSENAPAQLYYYGIFSPASSFGAYCSGGCVAGLAMLGGPNDAFARAGIGLGFSGDAAVGTALHEVGHNHGRAHAPCGGAQGTDPGYPHSGANTGAWGYDISSSQLFAPTTKDIMGYCQPQWISDYTFDGIFKRIQFVNGAQMIYPPELLDRTYDRFLVDAKTGLTHSGTTKIHLPPSATAKEVEVESEQGVSAVTAQFYPFDHLPGGVLLVPAGAAPWTTLRVQVDGTALELSR